MLGVAMWSSEHGGTAATRNPPSSLSMAEDEANSGLSNEEGSSSDERHPQNEKSPATQPPKKRKREKHDKTSCELCKARKVKCDRVEPACGACVRHNRTCVYLERQKPGSRIGFTLELEAKVNRIDALLQALGRRVEEHISQDQAHALSPAVSSSHASSQVEGLRHEGHPATPGRTPGISSPFWPPSEVNSGAQGVGRGIAHTPLSTSYSTTSVPQPSAAPDNPGPRQGLSSLSLTTDLPPHDMVYALVDLYFKHCNTWCPILDRKTTFAIFFGSTSLEDADRVLLQAIVATTLRFLNDARLSPEMKMHYRAVSKRAVQVYAMEHVSIPALRALVIICLDELGTSNGPRGWNMLAVLAQNIKQLDLCEESSVYLSAETEDLPRTGSIRRLAAGRPESWIEDEGRRRLCWMVYLLDRYATIAASTFDFMLDDKRMKRLLPCSYDLFSKNVPVETRSLNPTSDQHGAVRYTVNKPENLGSFSYHCEILRILSRVHDFLRTPIDVTGAADMADWRNTYRLLDGALDNWLQSLPSEYNRISALCHSDPASRVANWFMLHSAYVVSVVRLHSSAAYPLVSSRLFIPSHYAMQRCLSAVMSLADIAKDVAEANGLDLLGPPFAFSLWVAARLLLVHAAAVGSPVDPKIEFFIETLSYVGQYWEVANNYARILTRVVQRGRHGDLNYTAMRKSAYNLVSLTSSTRQSGTEQTSIQTATLSELDNIDIFEFFNFPKVAEPSARSSNGQTSQLSYQLGGLTNETPSGSGLPDPETDWLRYGASFT
ncbi:Quinic acid utilization activator [Paramyrothecium foliicola]|nr:Quinic acid utilization activator [Paramyrothecium foliicola]